MRTTVNTFDQRVRRIFVETTKMVSGDIMTSHSTWRWSLSMNAVKRVSSYSEDKKEGTRQGKRGQLKGYSHSMHELKRDQRTKILWRHVRLLSGQSCIMGLSCQESRRHIINRKYPPGYLVDPNINDWQCATHLQPPLPPRARQHRVTGETTHAWVSRLPSGQAVVGNRILSPRATSGYEQFRNYVPQCLSTQTDLSLQCRK